MAPSWDIEDLEITICGHRIEFDRPTPPELPPRNRSERRAQERRRRRQRQRQRRRRVRLQ